MVAGKNTIARKAFRFTMLVSLIIALIGTVALDPCFGYFTKTSCARAYADVQGIWRFDTDQHVWRYQDATGNFVSNGWELINGRYYCFDKTGHMRTGWIYANGQWYYCASSGAMVVGWRCIDNAWYYFSSSGAMQKGWQNVRGNWYHFASSGVMQTGWIYVGGAWYYLDTSGVMATGWRNLAGVWYHFDENGVMSRGWLKEGSTWYYLDSSGKAAQGWAHIGNAWYYFFPSSCKMAVNQFIDTSWVNENGVWDATQYSAVGLIQKVNQARAREGLPTLKWSSSLATTAALRAREAATYFSHTRPNGETCFSLYPSGFSALGENLAAGPNTVDEAHQGWMNSPSHRACLLDRDFNVMGAACVGFDDAYNYYWVECFGYDPNL